MNATVIHIEKYGLTARLDSRQPWPNATNQVQIHEARSPGVVSRHCLGDRISVAPGPDGVDASLDWVENL
jgi:hypothetical protein